MAHATIKGQRHDVRISRDLADNWALEVYPQPAPGQIKVSEPYKNWPSPLCLKICANSREDALLQGLEHMKKLGQLDDFHLDPDERPAPPPVAAEKPKAPAAAGT